MSQRMEKKKQNKSNRHSYRIYLTYSSQSINPMATKERSQSIRLPFDENGQRILVVENEFLDIGFCVHFAPNKIH